MARAELGDLGKIIEHLDERGRLIRVRSEVDPVHDLAGIAAKLEGRGAAVLFERVKGHTAPVFTGLYWSRALLADLGSAEPSARVTPEGLIEPLSERELDVLRLLRSDLDGPEIARELSVSLNTMRTHTKNIYEKLGVNNRRAAVRRADFHYDLPEALIAQQPLAERSASRMLTLDGATGALADRQVRDLPSLLAEGDLLVFNDTRVIPARLFALKESGGRVEVLLERPAPGVRVKAVRI